MRSYEERAKDFIKEVFPFITECEGPWGAREQIEKYNEQYNRKVIVSNGIARIALVTSDYVVKFNYDEDEVECVGGCEDEMKVYDIAEREGFAYLFAKISRYFYNGRDFYIMPRIYGVGKMEYTYANELMTQEERDWCEEHEIGDLHCNNYGFRNGHVCIIDYACSTRPSSSSLSYSNHYKRS